MKFTRKYSVFVPILTFLIGSLVVVPARPVGTALAQPACRGGQLCAVSLNPAQGAVGTSVVATASGFAPGDMLSLYFDPIITPQTSVMADANGGARIPFNVPNLPDIGPGPRTVTVQGLPSEITTDATFTITVQPPLSLSLNPVQGPVGTSVVATASGFAPGDMLSLFVFPMTEPVATATADANGGARIPFTVPNVEAGLHDVSVQGRSGTSQVLGFTVTSAGPTPQPTAQPTTTALPTAPPIVHDDRYFGQTGYRIDNDQIWMFFNQYGGIGAFGFPTSRTVAFLGCPVQFFQRQVIQICPTQGAALINILDPDIFPYTRVNGSVFPGPDPVMKANTPQVSDPLYAQTITQFVIDNVPNTWNGLPVNFFQTFNTLGGLTIWGAPISQPAPDPTNANFVYQRFQRGIMHFITPSTTESILLADYLKAIIINQNVPPDLLQDSRESRYYNQYCPGQPLWLCRPAQLPGTDFTFGFVQG